MRQSSQSPPRYPHSFGSSGDLIVLGLRYDIDEQEMRDYFQHFGEVEQVEASLTLCLVSMMLLKFGTQVQFFVLSCIRLS